MGAHEGGIWLCLLSVYTGTYIKETCSSMSPGGFYCDLEVA
jgi:hypothetical protein